ncbi:MAG: Mrp/NBP35 family ATP-binding protein [Oscillospiraceae bacterium]|nr:Mrp/NBP35 family ATP-binding protein [Oscillospiraceae bacterium]MCD8254199.1 Mrp/NBP35 family ATP-binding protein [Oscillospiraceae bacterium]
MSENVNSSNCSSDCSSCGASCPSRSAPQSLLEPQNEKSNVRNVIAVVSGKGGVGKSLVTGLLTAAVAKRGKTTAVLDADITGPSIPKIFGVDNCVAGAVENNILPTVTDAGTKIVSLNLMLQDVTEPVVWRGPVISGVIKQFWHDTIWGDVDYMFVDMPPGTGDVPLTVFQSLPVKGIVIVTSPQELVGMIVAKAVNMAKMMHVPVIGIVENMSYFECPDCGARHDIFGQSHLDETAMEFHIHHTARLPIDPNIAKACDAGQVEALDGGWLDAMADSIIKMGEQ